MKILVISSKYPPEYSGSGMRAQSTYKRLRSKFGIDYEVLANSIEFNDNSQYQVDGVAVTRLAKRIPPIRKGGFLAKLSNHIIYLLNFICQGLPTLKILITGNYDIIHTFGSSISINVGILYAKCKNKALIREICNNETRPQPDLPLKFHKILKYKFNHKSKVVAISRKIAEFCRKEGIGENNLWERPNPVDETIFTPEKKDKYLLRRQLTKFSEDDIVLVNISKFEPGKNQIFLIDIIKLLEDKYKLLIFGPIVSQGPFRDRDKSYYDNIIKTIENKGLNERIQVVTGFTYNIEEYYKLADIFVFPTLFEALGTPTLESIACGVPVVANKIEGVTDCWIDNGKTGFACELNTQKFADCIVKASKIYWKTLEEGSKAILEKASTRIIDRKYYEIIKSLADTTDKSI